jgi:DNA-binding beta-propeller fold protein YncE
MKTRLPRPAALLALLLTAAAGSANAAVSGAVAPTAQRAVEEGIAVELTVEPLGAARGPIQEGDAARVRLRFTDSHGGTPLSGLSPGAWMDPLTRGEDPAATCKPKVQSFLGGSWLSRPALDLNTYYALTLNEDATISVVDPLFGFGNSQLLAMVFLQSPGEDWALAADGERLFVSLPDSGAVAVIETGAFKVVGNVATGPRPRRLGLQPDGRYLWVAHEGTDPARPPGVTVIDPRTLKVAAEIPTGAGAHDLAWSGDSRFVFVANAGAGTVSVLDAVRLAKVRDVDLAPASPQSPPAPASRPTSIAWSSQAKMAYVVDSGTGTVSALSAGETGTGGPAIVARISVEPGLGPLRFAPGGRLGFLLLPAKNRLLLLDAATNRIVQTATLEAQPDQVTFSDNLAYVRHQGSDTVLMIPLTQVGEEGRPVPLVDFPGGQHPPGKTPRPTPADGIVRAPGGAAVLVANPLDQAIYYYKEGMAAPMGHFPSYGHPRAVLVLDRSLKEVAPGTYETTAKLGGPGRYEIALYLDNPRLLHCFPVEVAVDPARAVERQPLKVEFLDRSAATAGVPAGQETAVRFRLTDPGSGAPRSGLTDVRVLTFLSPGVWQQRQWASEIGDVGDGRYEVRFRPPEAGLYFLFVEVASAGLPLQRSPSLALQVGAPEAGKPAGGQQP